MRGLAMAMGLAIATLGTGARAQAPLEGPLAAPIAAAAKTAPTKPRTAATHAISSSKTKAHIAKTTKATKPDAAQDTPRHDETPTVTRTRSSDDPLSLGMKWNGSNESSSQTRAQNYDGTAAGTGAQVGVKLHF